MWKVLAASSLIVSIVAAIKWIADGALIFSLFKIPVVKEEIDAFGDKTQVTEWQDGFVLGLDIAGPVIFFFLIVLFLIYKRKLSKN